MDRVTQRIIWSFRETKNMVEHIKKRASLPTAAIGLLEALLFCGAFIAGGLLLQGGDLSLLFGQMLAFVAIMMISMVVCGVYKPEVKRSALAMFRHNLVGFAVAVAGLDVIQLLVPSLGMNPEFFIFVVLMSFFAVGTIRPVISNLNSSSASDRRTAA
jgi:hypothetical protein